MQRAFLHVGAQKTGTSHLQATFWQHRDALADAGVYLPGVRRIDHFRACMDLQEVDQEPDHPGQRWKGVWKSLVDEAIASGSPSWLISDETLAGSTAEQAGRAHRDLAGCEVHLIFTLREFSGLLVAAWQQHVRERDADRFREWLSSVVSDLDHRFWQYHDLESVSRRWGVPPERTHVVTVPRAPQHPDELWLRYASVLGVDGRGWEVAERMNPSLGDVEVELMRRIQERILTGPSGPRHRRLTKDVIGRRVLTQSSRGQPILIPDEFQPWVLEQHRRQVDHLRRSGVDVVGTVDDLAVRPERFGESGDPDADRMLDAALDVIERLVRRSARVERELETELHRATTVKP